MAHTAALIVLLSRLHPLSLTPTPTWRSDRYPSPRQFQFLDLLLGLLSWEPGHRMRALTSLQHLRTSVISDAPRASYEPREEEHDTLEYVGADAPPTDSNLADFDGGEGEVDWAGDDVEGEGEGVGVFWDGGGGGGGGGGGDEYQDDIHPRTLPQDGEGKRSLMVGNTSEVCGAMGWARVAGEQLEDDSHHVHPRSLHSTLSSAEGEDHDDVSSVGSSGMVRTSANNPRKRRAKADDSMTAGPGAKLQIIQEGSGAGTSSSAAPALRRRSSRNRSSSGVHSIEQVLAARPCLLVQ